MTTPQPQPVKAALPEKAQDTELPLRHLREYDGAAEQMARTGKMPLNMGSPGAIDYIEADPEAFEERVRQFKYALAMEATHAKYRSPCPFCGFEVLQSNELTDGSWTIDCHTCGAGTGSQSTESDAWEAWEKRNGG